jgi:hypothetical protein
MIQPTLLFSPEVEEIERAEDTAVVQYGLSRVAQLQSMAKSIQTVVAWVVMVAVALVVPFILHATPLVATQLVYFPPQVVLQRGILQYIWDIPAVADELLLIM